MNFKSRGNRNNAGSTIIIILIMASFIMILATVITTTTMMNLKMKIAGRESTKAFYTSEDAVDEVYAALGKASIDCFNAAYEEELSSISSYIVYENGFPVSYAKLDNNVANLHLRTNYTMRLLRELDILEESEKNKLSDQDVIDKYIGTEQWDSTDNTRTRFLKLLNKYLEENTNGKIQVESVNGLNVVVRHTDTATGTGIDTFYVEFTDAVVSYFSKANYYSYITFNGEVGMPDVFINFANTDIIGSLNFSNYALIGNSGIRVNENSTFNGNVYAGKQYGLTVSAGTKLAFNGANPRAAAKKFKIVSGGVIDVAGTMSVTGGNIWTTDIKITGESSNNKFSTTSTNMYVRDDLQVEADNCQISLDGEYYGYGYETSVGATHFDSSAIIVNGKGSKINCTKLAKLNVAGRAFITFDIESDAQPVGTGESVSININQEKYLVPSSVIKNGSATNPKLSSSTKDFEADISGDTFFAFDLLDKTAEGNYYISREYTDASSLSKIYYYLNFKDAEAAATYAAIIMDETDDKYEEYMKKYNTKVASLTTDEEKEMFIDRLRYQKTIISEAIAKYKEVSDSDIIQSDSSVTNVFTQTMYEKNVNGTTGYDFRKSYYDKGCRYTALHRILLDLDEAKDDYTSADMENQYPGIGNYKDYDVFFNFINPLGFSKVTEGKLYHSTASTDANFHMIAVDNSSGSSSPVIIGNKNASDSASSIELPYSKGIIVVKGDVIVRQSFEGIIFADGRITIEGNNVTIKNHYTDEEIKNYIESDSLGQFNGATPAVKVYFREIFRFWNETTDEEGVSSKDVAQMTFRDMVTFSGWRKKDDTQSSSIKLTDVPESE
ncbi:MAG: hypothetical protein ACI4E1_13700 [Lachnospira sp.]